MLACIVPARIAKAERECTFPASIHPNQDDIDVPANTRIWIHESPAALELGAIEGECTPVLRTSGGEEVPHELTQIGAPSLALLTPQQPLSVGATYELELPCISSGTEPSPVTFKVARGPDLEAPAVPDVQVGQWFEGVEGDFGFGRLLVTSDEPTVLVDVGPGSQIEGSVDDGTVTDVFSIPDRVPFVGVQTCRLTNWQPTSEDDSVDVRVAAVDLAGNVSAWSEPVSVQVESGCGCVAGGQPPTWRWSLLLGVFVGLGRRRRGTLGILIK
jgi:MYXO-CTERM domain-containing protein